MNSFNLRKILKQYGSLYLTILVILFVLKLFYRKADSTDLQWILAPTAWWVRALSGISFENVPHIGYVNHDLRFIIARSCSGFQFMLITAATLLFSFLHRILPSENCSPLRRMLYGFGCIFADFGLSYVLTILVNGLRIILSIYLPLFLEQSALFQEYNGYSGWLTPESLHTLIGTVVYFASLLVIYRLADGITLKTFFAKTKEQLPKAQKNITFRASFRLLQPVFWYFFFVLGIPFLTRAYRNGVKQFTDYVRLVIFACTIVLVPFVLFSRIKNRMSFSSTSRSP